MLNKFQNSISCFVFRNGNTIPEIFFRFLHFLKKNFFLFKKINDSFLLSSESGVWLVENSKKLKELFHVIHLELL